MSGEEKVGVGSAQILHRGDVGGDKSGPKGAFVLQECVTDGLVDAGHGAGFNCNNTCPGCLQLRPLARSFLRRREHLGTESNIPVFDWRVLAS